MALYVHAATVEDVTVQSLLRHAAPTAEVILSIRYASHTVHVEVVDNGVPQQVDLVSFEQIPLNVIPASRNTSVRSGRPSHGTAAFEGVAVPSSCTYPA